MSYGIILVDPLMQPQSQYYIEEILNKLNDMGSLSLEVEVSLHSLLLASPEMFLL